MPPELPTSRYNHDHYVHKIRRYSLALRWVFGVRFDTATTDAYADIISLARELDEYIDIPDRALALSRIDEIQAALIARVANDELLRRHPILHDGALTSRQQRTLITAAYLLFEMNRRLKIATNATDYIIARIIEGKLYATIIHTVASEAVQSQRGYRLYCRTLLPIGTSTNLINTITDIRGDYQRGETCLRPTPWVYARLAGHVILALFCRALPPLIHIVTVRG